ncbi:hypothetical protein EVAR_74547_1 [Eumeta japonica]|uniref:Integrase catalytic domain-containing protein n=1 Tax=Eumeta variegata TaxID=151549 RepID=A0A4C1TBM7_EUMVA|nr:hypothetical protein EVAR_74547_1 [Eumeta japonica]
MSLRTINIRNNIKHATSVPYRPQANGAAENVVNRIVGAATAEPAGRAETGPRGGRGHGAGQTAGPRGRRTPGCTRRRPSADARLLAPGTRVIRGCVRAVTGPVSRNADAGNGETWRRYAEQMIILPRLTKRCNCIDANSGRRAEGFGHAENRD